VKLQGQALGRYLRAPDPSVLAALFYGPDAGLVKERAQALLAAAAGDPGDPFRTCELTPADLKGDPARLVDEAAALPFTGGRRVVRLRDATDSVAALLKDVLRGAGQGLVILEAGELGPRAPLRVLCETSERAAAIACYRDEGEALSGVIAADLKRSGLTAAPDALEYLTANLGGDRALTRAELEKLALYMAGSGGPDGRRGAVVSLEDAMATVGDTAALGLDDLIHDVAGGSPAAVERDLERQLAEGDSPVTILRAAARHFMRLHVVAGAMARGQDADGAMATLRPPVFFRDKDRFRGQLRRWKPPALAAALARLTEAEIDCKTTGLPAETICRRVLAEIAQGLRP
jgi:DNA polymerase-3 subunit delta